MRVPLVACLVGVLCLAALAQDNGNATEPNITAPVSLKDTVPWDPGVMDFSLRYGWSTPGRYGSGDDHLVGVRSEIGVCPNTQMSIDIPVQVGDGRIDGNGDVTLGVLYRLLEQNGNWPSFALEGEMRVPTGVDSAGVDGRLNFLFTHDNCIGDWRGHLNGFVETINGDNQPNLRDFGWGVTIGMDGPLCLDGAVRGIVDYQHRNSYHEGVSNINILELGWQWNYTGNQYIAMSGQIGLDHNEDTPDFGVKLMYRCGFCWK